MTTKTTHTPGPWSVFVPPQTEERGWDGYCGIMTPDGTDLEPRMWVPDLFVATVTWSGGDADPRLHPKAQGFGRVALADSKAKAMANARLIAAAPDLLTMLRRLYDEVMESEQVFTRLAPLTLERVNGALMKATGD